MRKGTLSAWSLRAGGQYAINIVNKHRASVSNSRCPCLSLKAGSCYRTQKSQCPSAKASGVLEDGLSSNGAPRSTAPGGIPNPEKTTNCETQCPNPQSLSSGPLTQKQNGLRTTEAKREAKRMSSKEVTINVTDSIQQMDRSRRITKNCVN
ncbi:brain and acute leukemia cytoplasmic protein isoform X1 [Sapajus apella]|uniref:Brain and acute leukemia cytoplasmic protein isoform X1 n=1 Tax=Sapajus apella TaxID=9515 RepID=A0A6J3FPL1_SAPAP|nr:brain and acute leukemia cytoplasmic protein isoform X1 [Sapajus apella]